MPIDKKPSGEDILIMPKKTTKKNELENPFVGLRKTLGNYGLSEKGVAAAVGRSGPWLSKIINQGRGMNCKYLVGIAKATGIPVQVLLGMENLPEPSGEDAQIINQLYAYLPKRIILGLVDLHEKETKIKSQNI